MKSIRERLGDELISRGNSMSEKTSESTEGFVPEIKKYDPEVRRLLGISQVIDSHLGLSDFLEFEAVSEEASFFQHELIQNLIRNYKAFTLPYFDNGKGDSIPKLTERLTNNFALLYNSERSNTSTLSFFSKGQIAFCSQIFSGLLNRVSQDGDSRKFVHPINGVIFESVQGIASVNGFVANIQELGSDNLDYTSKTLTGDAGAVSAMQRIQMLKSNPHFSNR